MSTLTFNYEETFVARCKDEITAAVKRDIFILEHLVNEHYPLNFNWSIDELIETMEYLEFKNLAKNQN
jgi:hypothetical protein